MESCAGDRQGQKAEDPFLEGIESTCKVKGDADGKQPNREVNKIGVNWNGVRKIVGAKLVNDVVDR